MKNWKTLLGALEPPQREPLEVRNAVLDAVEDLMQPLGDGRRGLVHNRIVVRLLSAEEARRSLIHAVLTTEPGIGVAIKQKLEASGCVVPPDLTVEVSTDSPLPEGATQSDFDLVPSVVQAPRPAPALSAPAPRPPARLVMLSKPDQEIAIATDVFNIGRLSEVRGKDHRPVRRNHLCFTDQDTSVSRQHAHIQYFPESGEFRIFDDRSARGTRLFSNGRPIDVPPGRSRGEVLHSGDEIYFGSIGVRFEVLPK